MQSSIRFAQFNCAVLLLLGGTLKFQDLRKEINKDPQESCFEAFSNMVLNNSKGSHHHVKIL
ncbi:hypothetical protein OKN36_07810 [Furfurilactobacillus sp. OKN36]